MSHRGSKKQNPKEESLADFQPRILYTYEGGTVIDVTNTGRMVVGQLEWKGESRIQGVLRMNYYRQAVSRRQQRGGTPSDYGFNPELREAYQGHLGEIATS